jgi:protein TonB
MPVVTIPAMRVAPANGWVQIEFVVGGWFGAQCQAVDAQPRGVFEAAAVMAAQRCKFKPKMVDGKSVEQRGRRKWNFNLNQAAG